MLIGRPTKFYTGIEIFGDSIDLRELYTVSGDLIECVDEVQKDLLLTINYEVRKAYDGHREHGVFGIDSEIKYFGFKMIWPQFLFVVAQLRRLAKWQPTSARQHATLFRLESIIEGALKVADIRIGTEVWDAFRGLDDMPPNYLTAFIESVNFDYACSGSTGKLRFKRLPAMLHSLNWMSEGYRLYASKVEALAKAQNRQPAEIEFEYPWTDFKW